jgi:hypothetical protein
MIPRRALEACATLERRAAAKAASAADAARRHEARCDAERAAVHASRARLAARSSWVAVECAAVHLRRVRGDECIDVHSRRADGDRRRCRALVEERRKWARIRRGLERRVERLARTQSTWQG